MDEAAALERLTRMVAADEAPGLDGGALAALVALAARPIGTDPAEATVFDLNAAAAEGWRWKLAKLASADFSADGASFNLEGARRVCIAMRDHYAGAVATVETGGLGPVSSGEVTTRPRSLVEASVANAPEPVEP